MLRRLIPWVVGFGACLVAAGAFAEAGKLELKAFVKPPDYKDKGELTFYLDARDEPSPVEGLDKGSTWSFLFEGKPVPAQSTTTSFRTAELPSNVMIIFAATPNFAGAEEKDPNKAAAQTPPLDYALQGISTLKTFFGKQDVLSLYCYDEVRTEAVVLSPAGKPEKFTIPDLRGAVDKCRTAAPEGAEVSARLPTLLKSTIQKWMSKPPNVGGKDLLRYVVVIITDGASKEPIEEYWWKSLEAQFSDASKGWLEIYVVGLEDGGYAQNIQRLAKGGTVVTATVRGNLPDELNKIGQLVAGHSVYKVTFAFQDRVAGEAVEAVITAKDSKGVESKSDTLQLGKLERASAWWKWAILGAIALVVLILVLMLISWMVKSARERRAAREAEDARRAADSYKGPSKGKLLVRLGPAAGTTFHLVEDMSYIGRTKENHIQILDDSMGKRHASIRIRDKTYELEDLQSVNGVYVNGQRALKIILKDGDAIRMGATEMQFRLN
jgi:hypothetical protein